MSGRGYPAPTDNGAVGALLDTRQDYELFVLLHEFLDTGIAQRHSSQRGEPLRVRSPLRRETRLQGCLTSRLRRETLIMRAGSPTTNN